MKKKLVLVIFMAVFYTTCFAQITAPSSGLIYQVQNALGLALTNSSNNCVIATPNRADKFQSWTFEQSPDAGYYYLKNVGSSCYLFLGTANSWNMTFDTNLPADLTRAEFMLEAISEEYVGLKMKCNDKYLGTDDKTSGAWVFGDKGTGNNGSWQLVILSTGNEALNALVEQVQKYESNYLAEYPGLAGELSDALLEFGSPENTDSATIEAAMDTINGTWAKVKQGLNDATTLKQLISESEVLINTTSYPGIETFQTVYDEVSNVAQDQTHTSVDYAVAVLTIRAAIRSYKLSQSASLDVPADYTFLIQNPWFCKAENVPASNSSEDIAAANQSANVVDGSNWVRGSDVTSYGGLDEHASYRQLRTCWNAWGTNFNGNLDVHQDFADLPDGYYGAICDAITQSGCLNDQHLYASSAVQTVNAFLSTEGWSGADDVGNGTWETLNTASVSKVLVKGGKLTIGFRGAHDASKTTDLASDGRNGWFCVTNFKLQYFGKATDNDLLALFNAKVVACQAQADTMLFNGDKTNYLAVINAFKNASDASSINMALDTINKASALADVSIKKQVELLNSSYKSIKDSLAAGAYIYAPLRDVMQSAVDNAAALINAEGQTSACADSVINSMKAYFSAYAPEYIKVQQTLATFVAQSSKEVINSTLSDQVVLLKSGMLSSSTVLVMIAQIEKALTDAATNDIFVSGGADYTAVLVNPTCEGTAQKAYPKGWTISMINSGDAMPNNVGQQYDGNATGYYLDGWNGNQKLLLYNAHQSIRNLPNGTYALKAMCRSTGVAGSEGVYLYTIADNDSLDGAHFAPVKLEQCNITKATQGQFHAADGSDSLLYVTYTYGSIWEAAATATDYGTSGSELNLSIYQTNGNTGFGWHYVEVPAVVKNHELTIGFTNDSTFTVGYTDIEGKPCVPFSGWWISADNFTLTLTSLGNNLDWSPVTAITSSNTNRGLKVSVVDGRILSNLPCSVYNMNGQLVDARNKLPRGCYIVKGKNTVVKILVD